MNRRWPRSPIPPCFAAAMLAASPAAARASIRPPPSDGGPVIVGENVGKYNWWDLQSFTSELEFYGEFRRDRQTTLGQPTLKLSDNLVRFTNNIGFQSYIGHRNLIDLTGTVKLGLEDQRINSSEPGADVHQTPLTDFYDLRALIFGNSKTPVTAYSRRDETVTHRDFNSSLRTDTTEHGAILSLDSDSIPTRIQYFHSERNQNDPTGSLDFKAIQDTVSLQSQTHLTDNQRLELNYTFDQVDEDQASIYTDVYGRHDGMLTHYLGFGKDNRDSLRSSLRFFDRSGRNDQAILRLDEQLLLEHTENLESRYNFSAERQERAGSEQRNILGNATVRHKLFDSLISSATAGGSSFQIPEQFTSNEGFTSGSLDYTKQVPLGRLNATVGAGFNHQDNSDRGSNIFVVNEQYQFTDPFNLVIARRNIIPGTIVVTDVTGFQTYSAGLDYQVIVSSAQVELVRIASGSIADRQAVLITYEIGPEPGSRIDTATQTYSVRYSLQEGFLNGMSFYAYLQRVDHSVDAADPSLIILDDFTDLRYGAEYQIGDFRFLGEIQNHDSTVSAYDRWRLEGHMDRRLSRNGVLSLEVVHDVIDYRGIDNHLELDRAQARWTERIASGLDFSAYLQYRDERDDRSGNVRGFEQAAEVHWNFRQTRVSAGIRNSILDGESTDRTSQTITVGVIRSF